jgi:hypothetical protein
MLFPQLFTWTFLSAVALNLCLCWLSDWWCEATEQGKFSQFRFGTWVARGWRKPVLSGRLDRLCKSGWGPVSCSSSLSESTEELPVAGIAAVGEAVMPAALGAAWRPRGENVSSIGVIVGGGWRWWGDAPAGEAHADTTIENIISS